MMYLVPQIIRMTSHPTPKSQDVGVINAPGKHGRQNLKRRRPAISSSTKVPSMEHMQSSVKSSSKVIRGKVQKEILDHSD